MQVMAEGQTVKHETYGLGIVTASDQERTAIRDSLRAMKDFPALEGPISFGKNGDALKPVQL